MAASQDPQLCPIPTWRGRLYYKPTQLDDNRDQIPRFPRIFHRRRNRASRITVEQIDEESEAAEIRVIEEGLRLSEKLGSPKDTSLRRRLSLRTPSNKSPDLDTPPKRRCVFRRAEGDQRFSMPSLDFVRHGSSRPIHAQLQQAAKQDEVALGTARPRAASNASLSNSASSTQVPEEKPVAAGNGVSVSIHLTEPQLFLQGYDFINSSTRSTAMLRGSLHLKVTKSAKIKALNLRFRGLAQTRWPEGKTVEIQSRILADTPQEFLQRRST